MARYDNPKLNVAFEIPDVITVGMRLRYRAALGPSAVGIGNPFQHYLNLWAGAKSIVTSLECEYMTIDSDLEKETDIRIADAVMWVGLKASEIMYKVEKVKKN